MPRMDVTVATRDGNCPAWLFTPAGGGGPWPGVIFFMDALAIRPVLSEMGQRLADGGYAVLLPDLFYRSGPYEPMVPAQVFSDPKAREGMMKMIGTLDREKKISDVRAFIAFMHSRPEVKPGPLGATGYCMGGNYALTAAGAYPEAFAAVASFHGGSLATDKPDSPHRFLQGVKARVYVAGAIEDQHFTPEQKATLERALTEAGVAHQVETYPARHGFTMKDAPVYDEAAAERHWAALFKLLGETLKTS